jgi:hypothetical protein
VLLEPGQGLFAATHSGGIYVALLHALDQRFAKIRLVINEQYPEIAHGFPSSPHGRLKKAYIPQDSTYISSQK